MIYTDENGNKFEGFRDLGDLINHALGDAVLIKPIKKKVIDWSKVADGVAVGYEYDNKIKVTHFFNKVWHLETARANLSELRFSPDCWNAWFGGDCPLPPGVCVVVIFRGGDSESMEVRGHDDAVWRSMKGRQGLDIIAYRVTGLAEGWSYPE